MLTIRLRRMGSTKKPYFRVVVTEARSARDSSFVENVGTYHPRSKPAQVELEQGAHRALDEAGREAVRFGADAARASICRATCRRRSSSARGAVMSRRRSR